MMRRHPALVEQLLAGSIWIPAFAGKVGFMGEGGLLLSTHGGHSRGSQRRPNSKPYFMKGPHSLASRQCIACARLISLSPKALTIGIKSCPIACSLARNASPAGVRMNA